MRRIALTAAALLAATGPLGLVAGCASTGHYPPPDRQSAATVPDRLPREKASAPVPSMSGGPCADTSARHPGSNVRQAADERGRPLDSPAVGLASFTESPAPATPGGADGKNRSTVQQMAAASEGGSPGETYPIDLSSALALGGANNLQIQFVRERVNEAYLNLSEARLMWVPSLRAGIGYNRHDGRVQATEGEVIDASRNSLFIGGGAAWGNSPLTGGAGPPARLVMDLSLADAWFTRLAARQTACAAQAASEATMNDTLLAIGLAYFDLVEAHGLLSNAQTGLEAADRMLELTKKFAEQGQTSPSEVARAEAERGLWRQAAEDTRRLTITRSAELARLLRLDPKVALVPGEDRIVPLEIVKDSGGVDELVSTGLANRPELRQYRHLVAAADERTRQEAWRPWIPNLAVGYSAGSFGGGPSDAFDQGGRGDFDAVAVWELQNFGLGNNVHHGQRESQQRQTYLQYQMIRDRVAAEVTTATADIASYRHQMQTTSDSIQAADRTVRLTEQRIRQGVALPIELIQAIRARATAQDAHTEALTNHNRSQLRLLRAIGQPPTSGG